MYFYRTEIQGFSGQSLQATSHWEKFTPDPKKDSTIRNLLQERTQQGGEGIPALRRHFALCVSH